MAIEKDKQMIKSAAEELYIHQKKTAQEICNILQISMSTIRRWIKKYGWEDRKKRVEQSSWSAALSLQEVIPKLIQKLDNDASASNVDALLKAIKSLKAIEKNTDIVGHALQIFRDFSIFLKETNKPAAEVLLDVVDPFIQYLIFKYEKK